MRLVVLLCVVITVAGCASHTAPPVPGLTTAAGLVGCTEFAAGDSAVWAILATTEPSVLTEGQGNHGWHLAKVDPETGRVTASVDLGRTFGPAIGGMALGFGAVWIGQSPGNVLRIDASSNEWLGTIRVLQGGGGTSPLGRPETTPLQIAVGEDAVWVLNSARRELARLDPRSERTTVIRLDSGSGDLLSMTAGAGSAWIATTRGVSRIDSRTMRLLATVDVDAGDTGPLDARSPWRRSIAASGSGVWLVDTHLRREGRYLSFRNYRYDAVGSIRRIDPGTNRVEASFQLPGLARALAADDSTVWILAAQQKDSSEQLPQARRRPNAECALVIVDAQNATVVRSIVLGDILPAWSDQASPLRPLMIRPPRLVVGGGRLWSHGDVGLREIRLPD